MNSINMIYQVIKDVLWPIAKVAAGKIKTSAKASAVNSLALFLTFNIAWAAVLMPLEPTIMPETIISQTTLFSDAPINAPRPRMSVTITGYSSTPDQTDDTPFITASGAHVADGIVAANFLPFNTKIQIPKLFGDKVFVVKDRMHRRFSDRVDIWFPDRAMAVKFGLRRAEIVIL